jgi:hypothetical protein
MKNITLPFDLVPVEKFLATVPTWAWLLLIPLSLWLLVWKGLALWHAARRREPVWFVILLIVNTLSLLELVYLFGIAKIQREKKS